MKKSLLKSMILFFLFCIFIFTLMYSYSKTMFNDISKNFFRLHIIANSDSTEDQIIKYEIRDSILEYMTPFLKNANNKNDVIDIFNNHMDEIYQIVIAVTKEHQFDRPVKIYISKSHFPAKTYGNIILPEGSYDALKVEVGNAQGQNWWCVMYPCLCILDTNNSSMDYYADDLLSKNLGKEEFSLITDSYSSKPLKFKFKLIELFENL